MANRDVQQPTPLIAEQGVTIVVRGSFNPRLLSPAWLLSENLVSADDYGACDLRVISPPVASLGFPWGNIQVTEDSLVVDTLDPLNSPRCRDLVYGVLATLRHTPITVLGVTMWRHLRVDDPAFLHVIGDKLAPKEPWANLMRLPGMESLTIQGVRPDTWMGAVRLTVEPSRKFHEALFVQVNDHITLERELNQPSTRADFTDQWTSKYEASEARMTSEKIELALEFLSNDWEISFARSEDCINDFWRAARGWKDAT